MIEQASPLSVATLEAAQVLHKLLQCRVLVPELHFPDARGGVTILTALLLDLERGEPPQASALLAFSFRKNNSANRVQTSSVCSASAIALSQSERMHASKRCPRSNIETARSAIPARSASRASAFATPRYDSAQLEYTSAGHFNTKQIASD